MRLDTLRVCMTIVAIMDLECEQVDISNAFIEAELNEKIYITPPKDIIVPSGMVLLLRKSLYGLKQAARDWNTKITRALVKLGFI